MNIHDPKGMRADRDVNHVHNLLRSPVPKHSLAHDQNEEEYYQQRNRGGKGNGAQADKPLDAPTGQQDTQNADRNIEPGSE